MALVGLVRVSTQKQETARQHDALDPICVKVFEEKVSGKLAVEDRPGLAAALDYIRPADMLTVQEVDRLGRNLLDGLIVLNDLFQRGIAVKVLDGIAAGEHTERSLVLDLALALAEDRRRDIARKTKNGLEAARARGNVGGRPTVVDPDKRRAILARRAQGESLRTIAAGVGISVGVVHRIVTEHDEAQSQSAQSSEAPPSEQLPQPHRRLRHRPLRRRRAARACAGRSRTQRQHGHDHDLLADRPAHRRGRAVRSSPGGVRRSAPETTRGRLDPTVRARLQPSEPPADAAVLPQLAAPPDLPDAVWHISRGSCRSR